MAARGDSRVVLSIALALALAGGVLAGPSSTGRLDELKALVKGSKYEDAESGARVLLTEVEAASGADAMETAAVLDILVESLWRGGKARPPETRALAERAVSIKEKAVGPEHPDVAASLNNLGNVLRTIGEYSAARPVFERALAIREKALGPNHTDVAATLNSLGVLFFQTGDYAAARPLWERTLAIREKALEPDSPEVATSVNNLAALLYKLGDFAAVRPLWERALAIRERTLGPDHDDVAASLDNLAILSQDQGDYRAARPLYERAVAIREKALGPEHFELAGTLNNLANLLLHSGDYAAARPLYERALAIKEKALGPDHPDVALGLCNLGLLVKIMGDYTTARQLYERALGIQEKALGPDHLEVALSLSNLAALHGEMGDYAEERRLNERALAIREKALGPDHPEVASSTSSLAVGLESTGDYAAARPLFERALAIREKALGPSHPDVAASLRNLAILLLNMGDYAAARPLFERALTTAESALGPDHPGVAIDLHYYAILLHNMGDYGAARASCERALEIQRKAFGPGHPDMAATLSTLALSLAAAGDTAAAMDAALEAESISRGHLQLTGRTLSEAQTLHYASAQWRGLDLLLTLAGKGVEPGTRRRILDALVRSRAVVLDAMAARHRTVSGAADPNVAHQAAALASARTRLANLVVRGLGQLEPEIYRKLLDDARNEKELAEQALARASASFARELSRSGLGLEDVAASLATGDALVAFAQYKKIDITPKHSATPGAHDQKPTDVPSYLAFVMRSGERDAQVVSLGAVGAVDDVIARWKTTASNPGSEAAYRLVSTALRKSVWDPLAPALGNAGRVFVVPDGALNFVNLVALPVDDGGYLIDRRPLVHYVSAERDLVSKSDAKVGKGILAVGAPSYEASSLFSALRKKTSGVSSSPPKKSEDPILVASAATYRGQRATCSDFTSVRFGSLPGTGKETRDIIHLWEQYRPDDSQAQNAVIHLHGAAASETAFKRSAPGHRILHLATHGFFLGSGRCESALSSARGVGGLTHASNARQDGTPSPVKGENPLLLSGLALAGANHRSVADEGEDDGILTAEEIASLDLSGVEWAVLSACETGVGDVRAGEGVFGLRRAFQVAGTATLIMSLWSVDDEATRSWMRALYQGRLEHHLDTAEAVRQASLTVMRQRRKAGESTHPFYWAPFVASGNWR